MQNLSFDSGLREFTVNGNPDAVIRFSVTDFNLPTRCRAAAEEISGIIAEAENTPDGLAAADIRVRGVLDTMLGARVCDTAFGTVNCLTLSGGQPIALGFLRAVSEAITAAIESEREAAEQRQKSYLDEAAALPVD